MIGAGAVVTRDVPARAIVVGNPASVVGYADDQREGGEGRLRPRAVASTEIRPGQRVHETSLISGAKLYEMPRISDPRGHLTFAEVNQSMPFSPQRYFLVFGVPSREIRGEHAHRELHEFLVCVNGSVSVRLFDGAQSEEVVLNRPELGLHIPPMLWRTHYKYSSDAVLMVLASDVYREADYVRSLDEYMAMTAAVPGGRQTA